MFKLKQLYYKHIVSKGFVKQAIGGVAVGTIIGLPLYLLLTHSNQVAYDEMVETIQRNKITINALRNI